MTARWAAAACAALALIWGADGAAANTYLGTLAFKHGDFKTALKELTPEAKKGDAVALYTLGRMYSAGLGVKRDAAKAAALYKRAAERGNAAAQSEYGTALALGDGVEQNIQEGLKWLYIAVRLGNDNAREYAVRLGKYLPPATIADIREEAQKWIEKHKPTDASDLTKSDEEAPPPAAAIHEP